MTISTKFTKLVGNTNHLNLQDACIDFTQTQNSLQLNITHKGVIKSELNKTTKTNLENYLNVLMPLGNRYQITKHCNNPNCINPTHLSFEKRQIERTGTAEAQRSLWADEEHRNDRTLKIKQGHLKEENRQIHSNVYKQLHANNYAIVLNDDQVIENLNREDAKKYILAGASFSGRKIIYLSNDQLQLNKKFSILGKKGREAVFNHLNDGWNIGYSSTYQNVTANFDYTC